MAAGRTNSRTILTRVWAGSALLAAAACSRAPSPSRAAPAEPVEVTVFAAASVRDALTAIAADYEARERVRLVFNFGSSGDLARQILAAPRADVFLSAGEKELDQVEAAGLLEPGTRRVLLANQLVVIEPADGGGSAFTAPFAPAQLAGDAVQRLSLADPATVPAGRYAKAWLELQGVWARVAERVLPGVDVRAALAAVESGGAQAGIVYRTDANLSRRVRVVFAVPVDAGPRIAYPLAVLRDRPALAAARRFALYLESAPAQETFASFGFAPPQPSARKGD